MLCFPPLALAAIPLGIAGMSRAKKLNGNGKGMAIGGLITGIIGLLWGIAAIVFFVFLASEVDSDPVDGFCNEDRYLQDPDCGTSSTSGGGSGGINSDPSDGVCDRDRFWEDPDC